MAIFARNFLFCKKILYKQYFTNVVFPSIISYVPTKIFKAQSYSSCSMDTNKSLVKMSDKDEILFRAIDVLVKGHERSVLNSFMTFMIVSARHLDIDIAGQLTPKFIADRSTFLKSIYVHKKHRVQYERRTHRLVLQLQYLTCSTANTYLEYIERNIPAGVAMHVHKWQLERISPHVCERMKENLRHMTEVDWSHQTVFIEKMKVKRMTKPIDYQEYHTTKRFLLGTVM